MLAPSAVKERGTLVSVKFVRVSSSYGALQSTPRRPHARPPLLIRATQLPSALYCTAQSEAFAPLSAGGAALAAVLLV